MHKLLSLLASLFSILRMTTEWLRMKKFERVGEEREELRSRREQSDRVRRANEARSRAEREFDERMRDSGEDRSGGD